MLAPDKSSGPIVLGIKAGKSNLDFIRKVRSAWMQDDADLHLVSVVEDRLKFPPFYTEILGNFNFTEFGRKLVESDKQSALDDLLHLQKDLGEPDRVHVKVVYGDDPAAILITEAQQVRASLIAIEIDQGLHQQAPHGVAAALGIIQHSGVPLLVLRRSPVNTFAMKNRCLVIADDLSAASVGALREGFRLAARWKDTLIIHLHVIDQKLHTNLRSLAESSRRSQMLSLEPSEFMELLEKTMAVALKKRSAEYQDQLSKTGCTYETMIQVGNPGSKIASFLQEIHPELAVFGRRQRTLPLLFGIGRVTFSALLADSDGLLIVP